MAEKIVAEKRVAEKAVREVWGTGRRKTAVARVRVRPGSGKILVNGKPSDEYFTRPDDKVAIHAALRTVNAMDRYDVIVHVSGGGPTGQAGAIAMGLARSLRKCDSTFEDPLRLSGLLTRDSRMKERKKYGRRGARRGFQFSKR